MRSLAAVVAEDDVAKARSKVFPPSIGRTMARKIATSVTDTMTTVKVNPGRANRRMILIHTNVAQPHATATSTWRAPPSSTAKIQITRATLEVMKVRSRAGGLERRVS